jgi:hypothetical protein
MPSTNPREPITFIMAKTRDTVSPCCETIFVVSCRGFVEVVVGLSGSAARRKGVWHTDRNKESSKTNFTEL